MALSIAQLAAALRLGDGVSAPDEPIAGILTRLLAVGNGIAERLAPDAPEQTKDAAVIQFTAYLYDQPSVGGRLTYANAWRNSGAAAILAPWRRLTAVTVETAASEASSGSTTGGLTTEQVDARINALVDAWALAGSEALVPISRLAAEVVHALDQVPTNTQRLEDMRLVVNREWHTTIDGEGNFTWSRSRPANVTAAAALTGWAHQRANQAAVDAVDPALAFYWLTARIPRNLDDPQDYRYRQRQGGHEGFTYPIETHDLGQDATWHYYTTQILLLSGGWTTYLEHDREESTSTRYEGELGNGIVKLASLGADVNAAIAAGGGGGTPLIAGSISTDLLANLAVTSAKLADLAVTTAKIDGAAVTTAKLATGAVALSRLAGAVAARLAPALDTGSGGQVVALNAAGTALEFINAPSGGGGGPLTPGSVGTTELATGAVTTAKLASEAVSSGKLRPEAVTLEKLDRGANTDRGKTIRLSTPSLASQKGFWQLVDWPGGINDGSIALVKLHPELRVRIPPEFAAANSGQALVVNADGTALAWAAQPTATITDGSITLAKLADAVANRLAPAFSSGAANQHVALNAAGDGLVYVTPPSGGGGSSPSRTQLYHDATDQEIEGVHPADYGNSVFPSLTIGTQITALTGGSLEFRCILADRFHVYASIPVVDFKALPATASADQTFNGYPRGLTVIGYVGSEVNVTGNIAQLSSQAQPGSWTQIVLTYARQANNNVIFVPRLGTFGRRSRSDFSGKGDGDAVLSETAYRLRVVHIG